MGLSINGGAVLASAVVLGLAAWVIRRPIVDTFDGGAGASAVSAATNARVRFEPVAAGFEGPVGLEFIPGRPGREAIVLEKGGRARLVTLPELPASSNHSSSKPAASAAPGNTALNTTASNTSSDTAPQNVVRAEPGPDIFRVDVHTESELGLLGLAFHPRYQDNGLFYLNTNPKDDGPLRTRISEWYWRADTAGKELAVQKRVLLEIDQPYKNHDGGQLAFGPDGYLYIGMGDGGFRNDPQGHGQNLGSLLGKMLRIDINSTPNYTVPADNPFLNTPGARPEIWAYGLRNPWRFSFDPKGRLIAADVGQNSYEEVDIVSAGANMGWNVREAKHCFSPQEGCQTEGMVDPIFEYGREAGQSITGGYVYLGERIPWLTGKYVFGDFVTGRVWAIELPGDASSLVPAQELGVFPHAFSAFARAPNGELYAVDFARGLILLLSAS